MSRSPLVLEVDPRDDASEGFYPPQLRCKIDALNARLTPSAGAAVYKAGFAPSQATYDAAIATRNSPIQQQLTDRQFYADPRTGVGGT